MELVHFVEFTGLGQEEHGFEELPVGKLHHHSGSANLNFDRNILLTVLYLT